MDLGDRVERIDAIRLFYLICSRRLRVKSFHLILLCALLQTSVVHLFQLFIDSHQHPFVLIYFIPLTILQWVITLSLDQPILHFSNSLFEFVDRVFQTQRVNSPKILVVLILFSQRLIGFEDEIPRHVQREVVVFCFEQGMNFLADEQFLFSPEDLLPSPDLL